MNALLLGVGHPDRGDDAAGPLVAEALSGVPGITCRSVSGDPSSILTDPLWDTAQPVVVVDTVRSGARPGTVHRWQDERLLAHLPAIGKGTHDLGIATTLHLAAALDRLPSELIVIGIEGCRFDVGEPVSRPVRHAVAVVAAALAEELSDGSVQDPLGLARRALTLHGRPGPRRRRRQLMDR